MEQNTKQRSRKLAPNEVRAVVRDWNSDDYTITSIAKKYGISYFSVYNIIKGISYKKILVD